MSGPAAIGWVPVSPAVAEATLWFFGRPEGLDHGGFTNSLLETISKADLSNQERLRAAFPEHVRAYQMGAQQTYGIDRLVAIAAEARA